MPRPRSLTGPAIAAAALAVLDRDGLSGLTMRAVAKELRIATMGLYRYVADRHELEVLVVDHLLATVDLSPPTDPDWRDRAASLLERMRAAVSAHPATVPLVVRHRQTAPTSLRWIEAMLTVLTDAGFTGVGRVLAQRTLMAFLLGHLQNEHYGPLSGPGTTAMTQLAPADYPRLTETATEAQKIDPATEFRLGIEIVLRGLAP
ncbi:TetR/AcrR family transcriptional regulator C-terminal domain-containing protein [Nocardia sp. NBC_00565]|uniref:TetR/AcrR family transcriptional regulator n=1 Tax=Nocardia sp. NBC_00565 TaxID=2975993 RepID=UPI002E81AB11|nr:TetR/AcrR family transcriptional regulator C-terminal domain-containing protein [Nocardia sp. NBC_00565]WUC01065.1 TetR/AcrR family transcriptional regulator C-terminal domain-containing protein [Nocardia sp. NBC_00565]